MVSYGYKQPCQLQLVIFVMLLLGFFEDDLVNGNFLIEFLIIYKYTIRIWLLLMNHVLGYVSCCFWLKLSFIT